MMELSATTSILLFSLCLAFTCALNIDNVNLPNSNNKRVATVVDQSAGLKRKSHLMPSIAWNRFNFLKGVSQSLPASLLASHSHLVPTTFLGPPKEGTNKPPISPADPHHLPHPPHPHQSQLQQQHQYHQKSQTVLQMLKGRLAKIPGIKAYLLSTKENTPKMPAFVVPVQLDAPVNPKPVNKYAIWNYLKPKSIKMAQASLLTSPDGYGLGLHNPRLYYVPKPIHIDASTVLKEDPLGLEFNKLPSLDTSSFLQKLPTETEEMSGPVAYTESPYPYKASREVDTMEANPSRYAEQYSVQDSNEKQYYESPYHRNPHVQNTRPYPVGWVPNSKKWHPGPHKSAFYPDTRLIKFTIEDRIYDNSTRKPFYYSVAKSGPISQHNSFEKHEEEMFSHNYSSSAPSISTPSSSASSTTTTTTTTTPTSSEQTYTELIDIEEDPKDILRHPMK